MSFLPSKLNSIKLLVAIVASGLFAGLAEASSCELAANAQVDSTGVFLQQIVKSDQALPAVRLTDAPQFGKTLDLNRAQITDLLSKAAPNLTLTNWTGADAVEVSRRDHTLTEAGAISLLTSTLQKEYLKNRGELELNFIQPWEAPTVPDEPLTVRILEVPTAGVTRSFIIRFQLCTADETIGTWQATMQAHVWRNVWVAHSDLQRGTSLGEADVAQERRDVLGLYDSPAQFSTSDTSMEVADMVSAGNIVTERDLKPRTVMHRGQLADGVLQDGALNIMMKVEVLQDGAAGQIVKIRNPVSMHDLSGKIVNDQTIMISL